MYLVRALIAITVLTVTAEVTGAGQTSARPSASVVPQPPDARAPQQGPDPALLARSSNANYGAVTSYQGKGLTSGVMNPSTPLFVPVVTYRSGGSGDFSVAVGDVNGDGKPDLVVTNSCACDLGVAVLLGNGDGTFQTAVTYNSGGAFADSIAIADVNDDGIPDLVVANECGNFSNNSCSGTAESGVGVLLGNGDGTFRAPLTFLTGGTFLQSVVVADVDGDGRPDLLAVNSCAFVNAAKCSGTLRNGTVGVLLNTGFGTFQLANTFDSGGLVPTSIAVGDLNGNGTLDLVVANSSSGTVGVLRGNGSGFFGKAMTYPGNFPVSVAAGDVNGDGKLDLVVANGSVGVLFGNGDGTFRPIVTYDSGGSSASAVAVGDVNGDGKADLIVANSGSGTVGVLLGNGNETFQKALSYSSGGASPYSVAVADVNRDAKPDILIANSGSGSVGVLLNNSGVHNPTSTSLTSSLNPSIYGQKVTWTATVTSSGSFTPTGKVRFTWSGYTIGSATLNSSGVATLTRSHLNADTYPLTAVCAGDASNLGSTSNVVNQVVLETKSTATLTSSPNPSTQGQAVSFTAKISSPTVIPTGPVTFTAGKIVLGTAQLSGGKATLTISSLAAGTTKVTVTYYGDSNIAKSSASFTQTVH
jgi:hypothetical protein